MTPPSVWTVVLHWRGADDTLACLAALSAQDYPNCQVVLVDNASADSPAAAVRQRFPAVQLVENERNLGYAGGNNAGMQYALEREADYLLLLNNDTLPPPDLVSRLCAVAESDPRIGLAYPVIASSADPSMRYVTLIDWARGTAGEALAPEGGPAVRDADYASGCALFVRTAAARAVGLLDPAYFSYYEDVDWSLRCKRAGWRVVLAAGALVYHKGTVDQAARKPPALWFYYTRNQHLFISRHVPWPRRLPLLRYHTRECLLQMQAALQAGDAQKAGALLDGWLAGVLGRYGAQRLETSPRFKRLALSRLGLLLWLTTPLAGLRRLFPVRSTVRRLWRPRRQLPR